MKKNTKKKLTKPVAILQDGSTITIDDEVEFKPGICEKCAGVIFVVSKINIYETCMSGFMVVVHVKGHPERLYKSRNELGVDANWFRKIV